MAYAFDRLQQGAAQIPGMPWEKVSVRDGTLHILVGLGGSGLDLLRETKGLIRRLCCSDQDPNREPERVIYLGIDTDINDLTGSWICADGTEVRLTGQEQIPCPGINPNGVGGRLEEGRIQLQAQGVQLGNSLMSRLHPVITGNIWVCNVYLLAGTAGGTGGLALELAYALRELVRRTLGPAVAVRMMGYLMLPEAYNAPGRQLWPHMAGNAAACLEELERLSTLQQRGETFRQTLCPMFAFDTDEPPFDDVHFLGGRRWPDPYRDCAAVAAENILAFVADEERPGDAVGFWPGRVSRLYSSFPSIRTYAGLPAGGSCEYLAAGAAAWEISEERLNRLLEREFLDILKETPELDRSRDAAGATALLRDMGLEVQYAMHTLTAGITPPVEPETLTTANTFGAAAIDFAQLCQRRLQEAFGEMSSRAERMRAALDDEIRRVLDKAFTDPGLGPMWVEQRLRSHLIPELMERINRCRDHAQWCGGAVRQCAEERDHIRSRLLRTRAHAMQFGEQWNREFELKLTAFAVRLLTDGEGSVFRAAIHQLERMGRSRYGAAAGVVYQLRRMAAEPEVNRPAVPGWDAAIWNHLGRSLHERATALSRVGFVEAFYAGLLEHMAERFVRNVDAAALARDFLREILWQRTGWMVRDCLREACVWGALDVELHQLLTELKAQAVPQLQNGVVPFGVDAVVITVPADCPALCAAAENLGHAGGPLCVVVRSRLCSRISVQRISCGVRPMNRPM